MLPSLTFEVWRKLLEDDCSLHGKTKECDALGEYVLKLLYEGGTNPTVEALTSYEAKNNSAA